MEKIIAKCNFISNSKMLIPLNLANCYSQGMENKDIRYQNFIYLLEKYGGEEYGRKKRFADRADMNPAFVSQLANKNRNIGSEVARNIEIQLELPNGWMDQIHDKEHSFAYTATPAVKNPQSEYSTKSQLQSRYDHAPPEVKSLIIEILNASENTSIDQNITNSLFTLLKAAQQQNINGKDLEIGDTELYGKPIK
nr:hypothetical protein 10 [Piscirickettsiaceae bacterium]